MAFWGTLHAAEDLKITFDEQGLAAIVHNGVELVNPADGRFVVQGVAFTDPQAKNGVRRVWQPKPAKAAFDAATKTLLQEYDWGRVACVFTAKENRLDLRITVTNASGQPLQGCAVCPLRMILPNRYFNRFVSYYQDGDQSLPCHVYTHAKGSVALINPDHGSGSTALFGNRGGKFQSVSLCLSGPTEERSRIIRSSTTSISPRPDACSRPERPTPIGFLWSSVRRTRRARPFPPRPTPSTPGRIP